ncbi:MAG: 4-(cytidine 5'-diphospho)-2-C-methyl-D-erythritol kinase [Desulfobulbaceae bacterium]|nr:4-(cytidine 5'-diphospho)-2-C-methyl-D-erythritol kinase [Desulfobulbaceae bacterium]
MHSLNILAPAKINLFLKILSRRADGYHELVTLMQKVGLYDEIYLEKSAEGITLCCPDSDLPENENNIIFRAARLFLDRFADRITNANGVRIVLKKKIPVAAGLGGGSSDAAAILNGLKELFEVNCSLDELLQLGSELGADVPLFVSPMPAVWATGIGDKLQPAVSISDFFIILVNPGFSVSTQWVYENFRLTSDSHDDIIDHSTSSSDCVRVADEVARRAILPTELYNDLELVTLDRYKKLGALKERLVQLGAVCSMMSGSGPTIFGLFSRESKREAEKCLDLLRCEYNKVYLVDPLNDHEEIKL